MGHHFSKSVTDTTNSSISISKNYVTEHKIFNSIDCKATTATVGIQPIASTGPTINLQFEDNPINNTLQINSACSSQGSSENSENNCIASRPIIIKIQLAKMENVKNGELGSSSVSIESTQSIDLNGNSVDGINGQILNLTLNRTGSQEIPILSESFMEAPAQNSALANSNHRSGIFMNNNLNGNTSVIGTFCEEASMLGFQLNNELLKESENNELSSSSTPASANIFEYCEVLEQSKETVSELLLDRAELNGRQKLRKQRHSRNPINSITMEVPTSCCPNKAKSSTSKRRCAKCKCRDAIRGLRVMLEGTTSSTSTKLTRNKDTKEPTTHKTHTYTVSEHRRSTPSSSSMLSNSTTSSSNNIAPNPRQQVQCKRNSIAQMPSTNLLLLGSKASTSITAAAADTTVAQAQSQSSALPSNHLSIWAPNGNNVGDVVIHISSPKFVVEQRPNKSSVLTLGHINDVHASTSIHVVATELMPANHGNNAENIDNSGTPTASTNTITKCKQRREPIVHSQIDFVHFLVPDLERIINSSFYWGKMDRYEAEHLLEGMPEGTFLLRDSAQEEFLFSVTFRKYGRSLHARIEQSGHKFSFDCHDPGVFTARTVTGLLEHYKDPSCVMFFEPMLTIPLHRKNPLSLQQFCRGTIVSQTTYDGINQLKLPTRLKSYLKEYHYKKKLRVKPFDEPFYTCT